MNAQLINETLFDGSGAVLVTYKNNVKLVASHYLTDEIENRYWITSHNGDMPAFHKSEFETVEELEAAMNEYDGWQVEEIEA